MVSSSVFRGVKKITPLNITPTSDISNTLVETNNILVEIQNQLALDFAHRISREEDTLKKIRSQSQKDRRDREEKSVEGVKKVGSVIGGQVKKVAAPAISLLDRIKNFFLSLVTGFVINQAMKWLAKPGNAERIGKVFNFIGKNWKVILSLIGGVLIGRAIYKIYRAYRLLRKGLGLLGIGRRGAGAGAGDAVRRGGLIRNAAGGRRGFGQLTPDVKTFTRRGAFGETIKFDKTVMTRTKNPLAKGMQRADVGLKKLGRGMMKSMGMGPGAKGLARLLRPIFKRIPVFGALIDFAVSIALGEPIGRAAAKAVGAGLGGALGSLIPIPGVGTILGGIVGDMIGGAVYDMLTGGSGDKEEQPEGFNLGGRIGGKSGIDKNTVRVSKGEYVTREPEAKKLGYGFMDYQNEGGFFRDMKKIATTQESANKIFTDSLLSLKETTDRLVQIKNKEELERLLKNTNNNGSNIKISRKKPVGGGTRPVRNLSLNRNRSSTIVMPPINMAPITQGSPSPTQSAPPSGGNSIPVVNSIDIDNFLPFHVAAEFGII